MQAQLSPAEKRVFSALASVEGKKEMAEKLSLGKSTVHPHVHSIFAKLGVHSLIELLLRLLKVTKGEERSHDGSGDG